MEFRILGPLEVAENGSAVDLGAAKQQTLLGVLLLHIGEVVSTARLVDELWGDAPPATAPKAIQGYVHGLRKVLGPEAIGTRAGGYLAAIDPDPARRLALRAPGGRGPAVASRGPGASGRAPRRSTVAMARQRTRGSAAHLSRRARPARRATHGRARTPDRRRSRARPPRGDGPGAARARRRRALPGEPAGAADAGALPLRASGRGAGRLPRHAPPAGGGAGVGAWGGAAAARASDPRPRPRARATGRSHAARGNGPGGSAGREAARDRGPRRGRRSEPSATGSIPRRCTPCSRAIGSWPQP